MNPKRIPHMIEREKKYIEALEGKDLSCHGHWDMGYHQGRLSVLENIEDMPGPWIPVAERLPEPGDTVLIYIKHNYAEDGWRAYRVYEYTDHWVGMGNLCEVVAWMPLPEPYRSEN